MILYRLFGGTDAVPKTVVESPSAYLPEVWDTLLNCLRFLLCHRFGGNQVNAQVKFLEGYTLGYVLYPYCSDINANGLIPGDTIIESVHVS